MSHNTLNKIFSGRTKVGDAWKVFFVTLRLVIGLTLSTIILAGATETAYGAGPTLAGLPIVNPPSANGGTTVTVTVQVTQSTGTLSYLWEFSDGGTFVPLQDVGRISGSGTATLQITNAQTSDSGNYRCLVTDSTGTTNSKGSKLMVAQLPISQDTANKRYFHLGGTLALIGASGEYLPHIDTQMHMFQPSSSNPASQLVSTGYCTYTSMGISPNSVGSIIKAHQCIDQLHAQGLNLMRLWVSLNSSPGKDVTGTTYQDEQPFLAVGTQWDVRVNNGLLQSADTTFFNNLAEIVRYASYQSPPVVVEVTLFDPWNGTATFGPYTQTKQNPGVQSLSDPYFAQSETHTDSSLNCTLFSGNLDTNYTLIRPTQTAVAAQIVNRLYNFDNVYYELANEADFHKDLDHAHVLAWHKYIADNINTVETGLGNRRHMIAVNYNYQPNIDATLSPTITCPDGSVESASGRISIVNGHYARISNASFPTPQLSALDLLRKYNTYSNGVPSSQNTMIWGFNETKIAGYNAGLATFFASADSMRPEAWEFMLNGGGAYDLYAFDWGNTTSIPACDANGQPPATPTSPNNCDSDNAIKELGVLSNVFNNHRNNIMPPLLSTMKRMDDGSQWINVPAYPTADMETPPTPHLYWAAMQNNKNRWLLYLHHSSLSTTSFKQYMPAYNTSGGYNETYIVSNLVTNCNSGLSGAFEADWYNPSDLTQYTLKTQFTSADLPKSLSTPSYPFDVLLVIWRTGCVQTNLAVTKAGTGNGLVKSDSGGINCGPTCSAIFAGNTTVTLTATPADSNSIFTGWTGDVCSGTGSCVVTMAEDTNVTATFAALVDNAQFLSQSVPASMMGGLYYHVTLNYKNTGNTTWDTTNYWLDSQNPSDNTTWGLAQVFPSTTMYPGYFPSFYFVVRAPLGGAPNFQWRMVHSGNPFGDSSSNTVVNIVPAPTYYQGCWVDDSFRALPTLLSSGGETVESCRLKASNQGLLFAGLQYGGYCFGGNNLGRSPAAEDECNMPCTANSSEICGGPYRNSIWSTVQVDVSWVKPSSVSYGPANTLTVQGDAIRGTGTVQMLWQDLTANGPWNTVAAQSTPSAGIWANTIPSSNYCHSYAVKANYSGVTSQTFNYVGVSSGYCNETAWVSWIQPPWDYPGPAGSLVVAGGSSGAPAGTGVTLWWNDITAGTGWHQGATVTPDASGTWFNSIPNVNYSDQYSVYVVYDAYSTQTTQGVCTYPGNGGAMYCPR